MFITRKIQLHIHSKDAEEIALHYSTLRRWRYIAFRAANMVTSHLYVQEQLKDFFYFTADFHLKLVDQGKDEEGVLQTSKMNTTMQLLSHIFRGEMPNDIMCCINHSLSSVFAKEVKDYRKGEKSLRSYQRDQPLPFKSRSIKDFKPEGYEYVFSLFKIPFRTYLGRDRDKRKLLKAVLSGQLKMCTSSIVLEKSKIFLLATFKMDVVAQELDESVIAEASLSIDHPISLHIDNQHYLIGNKEEFLHRRLAIQSARQRVKTGSTFNRGGHGRKRKMKSGEHYSDLEKNYVEHRLHLYSRRLIDICVKRKAATIILVNQQAKVAIVKEHEFLLQNWSYFGLIDKIIYKAKLKGITVVVE